MEDTIIPEELSEEVSNSFETINGLIDGFFAVLPKLAIASVLFVLMIVLASFAQHIVSRLVSSRASDGVGTAIGRLAYIGVVFVGVLMAVAVVAPSVGAAELLQILGVGSVAIGFAFRDILQNFLAGLLILLREPFTVGHWIKFGSYEGSVTDISTRSTWLRTFDGRDVSIPNGEIFTNPVMVINRDPLIRTDYDVGVGYGADLDETLKIIKKAAESCDLIEHERGVDAGVVDLAASSVNVRVRWWASSDNVYGAKTKILKLIKEALDDAGIDMPYPHRQLIVPDNLVQTS